MFANKVVLITGGSAGIGAAIGECFAKEAASLAIVGRNETKLKDVAQKCKKFGTKVLIIKADVAKDDEAKTIVKKTIEVFGKLDILVNNAGILRFASVFDNHLMETFDEVMNTNLRAVVLITNLAAPYLKETKGNIVNISSIAGIKMVNPLLSTYCMSKAGMDHFTRAAAIELSAFGVRVNSINPGPVLTDMIQNLDSLGLDNIESIAKNTLLNRVSDATEIGDLVLYLTSEKAKGITGSCIVTDNGYLLK